jgi:membrane-associated PAP2 superfamily phosphatase
MQTFESGGVQSYPNPVTKEFQLSSRFWLVHAVLPALAFAVLLVAFQELPIDTYIARHWAYDATVTRWLGHGRWWADDLLHTDGRDAILLVIAGLLVTIGGGLFSPRWSAARGTAIYLLATIGLAWGLVGLLKHVTNVPCPWSLLGFGGERPHVGLFSPRPVGFGPAACFPGAHSASGFALFAFYFAFRDRRPRRARRLLAIAILIGAIFAFGQEARGAHFLSHDVSSAFLAWFVALGTYLVWRHPAPRRRIALREPRRIPRLERVPAEAQQHLTRREFPR